MDNEAYPDSLPQGYRLHWYVLERALGQGGFGITYLAHDSNLDRTVAIKEYLPVDTATRRGDATIQPRTQSMSERFNSGLEGFLREARTLARFAHPNIVRVHSVFQQNNTAYMVMDYEAGETLASVLDRRGTLPEAELAAVLLPLLDGLALVHEAGFIHRDIKPENILLRTDGSPVLLDFGSARTAAAGTVTILVAPGYAPYEQYYSNAHSQGPWTDLYGLGATSYRAVTGKAPLDAISRSRGVLGSTREILEPVSVVAAGRYSARLLKAIDHALAFAEQDRPQTVMQWRDEILLPPPPQPTATAPSLPAPVQPQPGPAGMGRRELVAWFVAGTTVAASVSAWLVVGVLHATGPAATRGGPPATLSMSGATPALPPAVAAPPAAAISAPAPAARKPAPPPETRRQAPGAAAVAPSPARSLPLVEADAPRAPAPAPAPAVAVALAEERPAVVAPAPAVPAAAASAPAKPAAAAPEAQRVTVAALTPPAEDRDAFTYYRRLALAGHSEAQFRLGESYANGRGVARSANQAYLWFALAARSGHADAPRRQSQIAAALQPAELRQLDRLVQSQQAAPAEASR